MKLLRRSKLPAPHPKPRPSGEELFHAPGESPAVYSITRSLTFAQGVDGSSLAEAMIRCVEGIRDWAAERRHLVGHIKVFVENGLDGHLWLASTGKQISVKRSGGWDTAPSRAFQVHFTAIIFGPSLEHLKAVAAGQLQRELDTIHP